MIGDDQIDPELPRPPGRADPARAAVDRHEHGCTLGSQPFDRRDLKVVAVADPIGDEVNHVRAEHLQRPAQDHGGGDAVHVVVAVDGDPLLRGNRREEAIDCRRHAGQAEWVPELVERRREEPFGLIGIGQSAQA
jgi:hypothetical protein